jgi:hypothetical protein
VRTVLVNKHVLAGGSLDFSFHQDSTADGLEELVAAR